MRKNLKPGIHPELGKLLLFIFLFFFTFSTHAQMVSGTVSDETGKKISSVSVTVKGSTAGTTTDASGQYRINAASNTVLIFSSVGFTSNEVSVAGRLTVDVVLTSNASKDLGEVVVTALGISKQSRGLGFAASNVKADELTLNRTPNVINALQGKIAGVNITSLGAGPASTSKIRIRGQSSVNGQNNPLIVINGVPINNSNFGDNAIGVNGGGVFADGGDGLSSINPDDIENMTILKGAPAAALYGSRAKDGVIMITTKTKGKNKGIGVSYNANYTSETPLDYTDFQTTYGQGEFGLRPTTPSPASGQWSFGEKILPGMTHILFDNLTVPYVAQGIRTKEFYRNGQNFSNTISMESSNEKGGMHLSLNNTENKGIVPNNTFNRKNMNLGFSYNLSDKFSYAGNINYTREYNRNPPNIANQDNTIPNVLMAMASTMPLSVLKANKYNAAGNEYPWSRFTNRTNPYFVLSDQFHNIKRDRLFGNISAKYKILPWLSVMGRFGQDYYSRDEDFNNYPTGQASRTTAPVGFVNGAFTQESRRLRETNLDFLVTANRTFGDFDITLTGGGNQLRRRVDVNNVLVTDFAIRGLYNVQNGRVKVPVYGLSEFAVNSLYSSGEVSWKRMLYLTGTARNDWFSTLSAANRSILYPSVSGAFVFSEVLKKAGWLNFGKLRLGYAEVGSDGDVDPYSDQLSYNLNALTIANPLGTQVSVGNSGGVLPNPTLKPSRVMETEIGLELKMFNNRVNLDVAAYRKITIDQIISVQISDGSGYTSTRINSGKSRNMGFEVLLNLIPVQNKNFTWSFTANTGYNKTKVLSAITNTPGESFTVGFHSFNGELRHVVGQEIGQLAGFGFAYDPTKGNQKIFKSDGLPLRSSSIVLFGSALPKWTGGFLNSFVYKGISLSVFVDYKLGGKMISGTNFNAIRHGLHKMTLEGRDAGVIGQGVNQSGATNTVVANNQTYWTDIRTQGIIESSVFNSGYWKLRQIGLGYDFTKYIPAKWPIKGLKLDFVANNVLLIKKWVDNIDPETFGYASDNRSGLEAPGLPTTRGMGLNLNIKF